MTSHFSRYGKIPCLLRGQIRHWVISTYWGWHSLVADIENSSYQGNIPGDDQSSKGGC